MRLSKRDFHISKRAQQQEEDVNLFQIFPRDKFINWTEYRGSNPGYIWRSLPMPPGIEDAHFRARLISDQDDYALYHKYLTYLKYKDDKHVDDVTEEDYREWRDEFVTKTHVKVSLYYDPNIQSYEEEGMIQIYEPEESWETRHKGMEEIVTIEELPNLANKIMPLISHLSEIYYTMQDKFEESQPKNSPYRILPPQIFNGWKMHFHPKDNELVAGMETKRRYEIIQTRLIIKDNMAHFELNWPKEFLRMAKSPPRIEAPVDNIPNLQHIVNTIKHIGQLKLKGEI